MSDIRWYGNEVSKEMEAKLVKRLDKACRHLRNQVIKNISRRYPPASDRGEYPAARTGQLRRSIETEIVHSVSGGQEEMFGRVGTNLEYAKYLELPQYLDRSFLRRTLAVESGVLKDILLG